MTDPGFGRVERLFQEARRLHGLERERFLEAECGSDRDLSNDVAALLAAHDAADDLFASPPVGAPDLVATNVASTPQRIGRFRLLGQLGAGGMGVVHLAEQEYPRRVVALKVIRPGLATDETRRRFLREAQALAQLRHPGIAQIFEAGVEDDVPYIAMEHVDGEPLPSFVAKHNPTRIERIELLCKLCDAVQHAHDHGVIHRDLKPSNVLVEGDPTSPRPMIVDFGIAQVNSAETPGATAFTGSGQLIGTLSYMSPEQATGRHDDVDLRTDVHALGVILFELLTGKLPRDLRGFSVPEAARRIADEEPTSAARVDPTLAGDLDTIVATALAREKDRRYSTAAAFAADLRRFLRDEPIAARAQSAVDHIHKLMRRHRAVAVGATLVLASLALGLLATTWQWRRALDEKQKAERRFDELRDLATAFMFEVDPKLRLVPGALDARRSIVATGLEYLDRLAAEAPDDPKLQLELAAAYQNMGDIQGSGTLPNLGDFAGALRNYRKAESLLLALDGAGRETSASCADLVVVRLRIGDARFTIEGPHAARDDYESAAALVARWKGERPADPRIAAFESDTAERRGNALFALGMVGEAEVLYRDALRVGRERASSDPENRDLRRNVGVGLTKLARCAGALGRNDDALTAYAEANREFSGLLEKYPESGLFRRDLAVTEERMGQLLVELGRKEEAETRFHAALAASEAASAADPLDVQSRLDVAIHSCRLGELRLAANDLAAAEKRFLQYLDVAKALAGEFPTMAAAVREHGVAHYKIAELARARVGLATDPAEILRYRTNVESALERALEVFRELAAKGKLGVDDANVPSELEAELNAVRAALRE
jgi:eukaryotic-like serine/threonine-protein kinase